jgi:membrane-associated phospholipid phosphatase
VARDALAGPPDVDPPLVLAPRLTAVDDPAVLPRWGSAVRSSVFDTELASGLVYGTNRATSAGTPARPRGLTLSWLGLDTAERPVRVDIATLLRPARSDEAGLRRQLAHVLAWAEIREDRLPEILSQVAQIATPWASIAGLSATRTPHTNELLGAAMRLCIGVEMRFKHALAFPRPVQYSPQIQPLIQTPAHSAYPSGHATEAFCQAVLLARVIALAARRRSPKPAANPASGLSATLRRLEMTLLRQAARIAINRQVAGVHFPIDSRAGQVLGTSLAGYIEARATGAARIRHRAFDAEGYLEEDFLGPDHDGTSTPDDRGLVQVGPEAAVHPSAALGWMWERAVGEWV